MSGPEAVRLSRRLLTAVSLFEPVETAADIGADHGLLSVYLVQKGLAGRVLACDVNPGPLSRARESIARFGLEARIEARLGDGLAAISPGEAEGCFICGMGGRLLVSILERSRECALAMKELVLQPQSELPFVRRALHELGLSIKAERVVFESGHFYTVLRAEPGAEERYNEAEYFLGKRLMEERSEAFVELLRVMSQKRGEALESLRRSAAGAEERERELLYELELIGGYLNGKM